uniref:Uncharacterized protein n=1 Tax=Moniliophthora roreri TaxID=221103 RepID=A0A0W0EU10_MONRR
MTRTGAWENEFVDLAAQDYPGGEGDRTFKFDGLPPPMPGHAKGTSSLVALVAQIRLYEHASANRELVWEDISLLKIARSSYALRTFGFNISVLSNPYLQRCCYLQSDSVSILGYESSCRIPWLSVERREGYVSQIRKTQ